MAQSMAYRYGSTISPGETLSFLPVCFCNAIDDAINTYGDAAFDDFGYAVGMTFRLKTDGTGCIAKTSGNSYSYRMELEYIFKDAYDFAFSGEFTWTSSQTANLELSYTTICDR